MPSSHHFRSPAFRPLYSANCAAWSVPRDGDFQCGSSPQCDFRIHGDQVLAQHCRITFSGGTLTVHRGAGRVWINDLPVIGAIELESGDRLSIGAETFLIEEGVATTVFGEPLGVSPRCAPSAEFNPPTPTFATVVPELPQQRLQPARRFIDSARARSLEETVSPLIGAPLISLASPASQITDQASTFAHHETLERERILRDQQIEADRRSAASEAANHARELELSNREQRLTETREELARRQLRLEISEQDLERRAALLRAESDSARLELQELSDLLNQRAAEIDEQKSRSQSRSQFAASTDSSATVEQLTQLAKEREAILRAREEASRIQAEARQSLEELALRSAEIAAAEAQLDALQQSTSAASRTCSSEREALQSGHRDLQCERNALNQLSKDLTSRESGLHERERVVARQTDELRQRFDALQHQSAQQSLIENELNARELEFQKRQQSFDHERHAWEQTALLAPEPAEATPEHTTTVFRTEVHRLTQALQSSEERADHAVHEQTALLSAVQQLQAALRDARNDVEEASQLREQVAHHDRTLQDLYTKLEERNRQVQQHEAERLQMEDAIRSLQAGSSARVEANDEVRRSNSSFAHDAIEQEQQLLTDLESLRSELKQSAEVDAERSRGYQADVAARDAHVVRLQAQVADLESQLSNASAATPIQTDHDSRVVSLQSDLDDLKLILTGRDALIRELQTRLKPATPNEEAEQLDRAELDQLSRDLDRRAELLDRRDEELRQKAHRVEQFEEDVELQRRDLLDARQQLEIARSEVQVAMRTHAQPPALPAAVPMLSSSAEADSAYGSSGENGIFRTQLFSHNLTESSGPPASGVPGIREDLANLFGINATSSTRPAMVAPAHHAVDLSEAVGSAVQMRFGGTDSVLLEAPVPPAAPAQEATADSESSDDFVRDYMEQLLSRSRKGAGTTLPNELKPSELKPVKSTASAATSSNKAATAGKSPPKVKSFIEQYMASGSFDGAAEPSGAGENPTDASHAGNAEPGPLTVRAKVDVQKLRQNLDSFRTVSTQSVENALVTHAMRQDRLQINGRIAFVIVLILMAIFMAIAEFRGIMDQPMLFWMTLVAAVAASLELARTTAMLKIRCRQNLTPENTDATRKTTTAVEESATSPKELPGMEPVGTPPLPDNAALVDESFSRESSTRPTNIDQREKSGFSRELQTEGASVATASRRSSREQSDDDDRPDARFEL